MLFGGMNYLAIPVAALAAWLFGALYYTALAKPWVAALGASMEDLQARHAERSGFAKVAPFILSLVGEVIMAWVIAGVLGHLGPGQVTLRNGIISAGFLWFGFVLTTVAINNAYPGRKIMLTVIDSLHWLGAMLIMGAVIGAIGVR